MKNLKKILVSLLIFGIVGSVMAQTVPNVSDEIPAEKRKAAGIIMDNVENQYRYMDHDYSCTVSLIVEKPGEPKEQLQFKLFQRAAKDQFSMIQLQPEADKGAGFLQEGDNFWYYDPIGRKFSHTSLKENIGNSDTKASDLNKTNTWRNHYKITTFDEGKVGSYAVYIITLQATTNEPSYAKTVFYIRQDLPLILKQEDYSANNRLMRTMLVPKYTKANNQFVATQIILRDEVNKGEQTQQIISEISFAPIPDKVFTKAYLEQIN